MSGGLTAFSVLLVVITGIRVAEGGGCRVRDSWRKFNSHLKHSYPPMVEVTLKCPGRLQLVPELKSKRGTVMCLFGGKWNFNSDKICTLGENSVKSKPKSDDGKCHPPSSWRKYNPNLKDGYVTMSEIQLTCPAPRKLVPDLRTKDGTVMCLFGGKWSFTESEICTAAKTGCETHHVWRTFNRRLRRKYREGSKIKLSCPRYLRMHLVPELENVRGVVECLKGGKWSMDRPAICIAGRRRRPTSTKKPCHTHKIWRTFNRQIRREYKYGTSIKLSCPRTLGVRLLPELEKKGGVVKCLADGKWSFKTGAICIAGKQRLKRTVSCQTPWEWKKVLPGLGTSYPTAKVLAFKCPPYYGIHPRVRRDSAGRGVITCHGGGKWDFKSTETPCVKKKLKSTSKPAVPTGETARILAQATCSAQAMTKGFVFAVPKSCKKDGRGKTCDDVCGDTKKIKQDKMFRSTKVKFRFTCEDSIFVMYLPKTPSAPFIKTLTYQTCRKDSCLINYCCCHASFRLAPRH
ncbi:uncharacterized protein LOC135489507 isoform X1 [Lineus longissimus]|uniref:uncharacterized protein LOC135489507 isoform X1 n=1 Tax=Lineus longissimus TaxID=88925 RepID=UPI002B4F139C